MHSAGASNVQGCSSRELLRRWNGLGQKQWTWKEDREVFDHLASASLQTLDELSAPIVKVAQHIDDMSRHVDVPKQAGMYKLLQSLCPAPGCGLQQLGVGLRLYLDSGKLPAAATGRALDAIITLCLMASKMYAYAERVQAANPDDLLVQGMRADMAERVLETGTSCGFRRRHQHSCCTDVPLEPLQDMHCSQLSTVQLSTSCSGMHLVSGACHMLLC
jgi:hypothetical protein